MRPPGTSTKRSHAGGDEVVDVRRDALGRRLVFADVGRQVEVTGTVYGYYAGVRSCDIATQLAAAATAAAKGGYVASKYDHLVVYTPDQGCGFSGIGWVGFNGVFLNGDSAPGVMEHELGHNLGLWHAGHSACGAKSLAASCVDVYGDVTDVMGRHTWTTATTRSTSGCWAGYPASEVRTVTSGTHTIALTASEHPVIAGSTELIHVRVPTARCTRSTAGRRSDTTRASRGCGSAGLRR